MPLPAQRVVADALLSYVLGADAVADEILHALSLNGYTLVAAPDPAGFDEFWRAYPRKIARKHAHKTWCAAVASGVTPDQIMQGLTRWINYWQREQTQAVFVPHPRTWLNGGYYADEPIARVDEAGQVVDRIVERAREMIGDAGTGWLDSAGVDRSVAEEPLARGHRGAVGDGAVVVASRADHGSRTPFGALPP